MPGVLVDTLTWVQAQTFLTREAVVVVPLGATAKEHGPHLQLNTDRIIAEYLKQRVVEAAVRSILADIERLRALPL